MTTTLKKALALAMCLTMLVLAVPGFASGEATGPEANAAREMVNIRFSQYANSVDDQEGMANDPIKKAIEQAVNITLEYDTGIEGYDDRLSTELAVGMAPDLFPTWGEATKIRQFAEEEAVYDIAAIINGDLDELIDALVTQDQAEKLRAAEA